jgi:hypothetical protein
VSGGGLLDRSKHLNHGEPILRTIVETSYECERMWIPRSVILVKRARSSGWKMNVVFEEESELREIGKDAFSVCRPESPYIPGKVEILPPQYLML